MNINETYNTNLVQSCNGVLDLMKAYEAFDWIYYTEYYNDVSKKNIKDKLTAWNHWYNNTENTIYFSVVKKEKIFFDNFDWVTYISVNEDLSHMTREEAWNHWIKYGFKESRGFKRINSSSIHKARFGNLFFVNMAIHFIAIRNNLCVNYKYNQNFIELGIRFFTGKKSYEQDFYLTDYNFFELIKNDVKQEKNIVIDANNLFCQKPEFCFYIKDKFDHVFKENIKKKNNFKKRYNNNNDVFVHIRLGDLKDELSFVENKNYYDKTLSVVSFDNGYISSDSIENDICVFLIKKYKLTVIDYDEVNTIMFASTCNNIILSGGTFSWLIGFLAFYSNQIYYPKYKNTWYDDIFVFDNWFGIEV
jgi:hypothetical protein